MSCSISPTVFNSSPPDMGVNNVAEGAEILGGVGGWLVWIRSGRFGEVKWGLYRQLWGMEAYLGQRALRHKQLGLPSLVYASRREASRHLD